MTAEACDWPVSYASCGTCEVLDALPPEEREMFEQAAIDMLWNVTNRLFGTCPVEVRPCSSGCESYAGNSTFWGRGPYPWAGGGLGQSPWYPVLVAGQWYNISCGCTGPCTCAIEGPTALRLPGPVSEILEVRIDGVIVPPTSYRLDYQRILIRIDGGVWPVCQDLLADPHEDSNTFLVTYAHGIPVPVGGQLAAGVLACEMAKAACNDKSCQLPQRLQSVTRQGVTMGFLDTFEDLDNGRTGIWAIDSWTASVTRPKTYSSVRSVDVPESLAGRPYPSSGVSSPKRR